MRYKSVILGFSFFFLMATVPGKGHLSFEESFRDLERVKQGGIYSYSFIFANVGEKRVKISSVIAFSDCLTIMPLKDSLYENDEDGEIIIEFDTNKHAKGDFAFAIDVNSNADNKKVKLKLFGTLE